MGNRGRSEAKRDARLSPDDLERADRLLVRVIDGAMETAADRAGDRLACRPGCTECCIGPFPINHLDARRLRRGLARLEESDPGRARAVRDRAREAVAALRGDFPGDPASGDLSGDHAGEDRFFERHGGLPCPVLDPASGTCDLYASRPISCRTYGPPVRFGGQPLPPCRLCFVGATAEEIERGRVEPDDSGIEDALLRRLRSDAGGQGETIIPFALLTEDREEA